MLTPPIMSLTPLYSLYPSSGGVRIGAPALTTRGFKEADFVKVADFLDRALKIALRIQVSVP